MNLNTISFTLVGKAQKMYQKIARFSIAHTHLELNTKPDMIYWVGIWRINQSKINDIILFT
jgi:hypothetical protein